MTQKREGRGGGGGNPSYQLVELLHPQPKLQKWAILEIYQWKQEKQQELQSAWQVRCSQTIPPSSFSTWSRFMYN